MVPFYYVGRADCGFLPHRVRCQWHMEVVDISVNGEKASTTKRRALCPRHGRFGAQKTISKWVRTALAVSVMYSQCIINISFVRAGTAEILAVKGRWGIELRQERCRVADRSIDGSKVLASLHR